MDCPTCGVGSRAGSRFCDQCGSALEAACPACGGPNRADARFCASCGQALTEVAAGGTPPTTSRDAERRLVSVLFIDLVGFTSFAEGQDAEAVRDLLSRYFELATDIVERHGGAVEKFIGDAVMAVWGAPVAHEDDAERAVRAALELVAAVPGRHPELRARAAVLTGEAVVTLGARNQGMVAGDLVNTAARLQGLADAGTVLVGEATMRAAQGAVAFEAVGDRTLKGKSMPVPAWQAVRVVAARGGQGRADTLEAPFVGRDEELRQLKEVLHGVGRDRRPRLVSITGTAGIGKSRLVWELEKYVDGVAEEVFWHRGRSPSYGEGITFWALGEMVRRRAQLTEDADEPTTRERIGATVAGYVTDQDERARIESALLVLLGVGDAASGTHESLFPAWRQLFERIAERGTTVLVFEDIQWADSGLLDFIDHLLDWTRGLPILIITLARPELFDRRPDWGSSRRSLTTLALEPLSDADMRLLLDGLVPGLPPRAADEIVARAEGIPLYAVETVRSLLAEGRLERDGDAYRPTGDLSAIATPDTLRALIASRLDSLPPADRGLLQDAAVLGQVFRVDDLAAIAGVAPETLGPRLRDLARRELLDIERDPASPERGRHKFVQSLIREVAYGMLARRDRRTRHLAVARHIEAEGDDEAAGALASHYLAAREASEPGPEADALTGQARLALVGAADRAVRLGAHDQAVAFLDEALAITADPGERAALLDRAARSAVIANRESIGYADAAVAMYRELGDGGAAIRATTRLGKALIDAGEIVRAMEVLEGLVPEAEAGGDDAALADILANLSRAYMRMSASEQAVATADRALAIAEPLDLDALIAEALNNKAGALGILGRRREAVALQEAALALAAAGTDRSLEMRVRNNLAVAWIQDDPGRALEILAEAAEIARNAGDRVHYSWMATTAAGCVYSIGRGWDESLAELRDILETSVLRSDRLRLQFHISLFVIARGEPTDELLAQLTDIAGDAIEPDDAIKLRHARARAAIQDGNAGAAFALVWEVIDEPIPDPEWLLQVAVRAAAWAKDLEHARRAVARLVALPRGGAWPRAIMSHAEGLAAALEGRVPEALAALRDARAAYSRMGLLFEMACNALDAAIVLPDEPEVRAWAEASRPLLVELRALPWLERLDAMLAGAPPATATRGVAEVSAAER